MGWAFELGKAAAKTYRHKGESKQDCIGRKISVNKSDGMPQQQAVAAAHSMCGASKTAEDSAMADALHKGIVAPGNMNQATLAAIGGRRPSSITTEWATADEPYKATMKQRTSLGKSYVNRPPRNPLKPVQTKGSSVVDERGGSPAMLLGMDVAAANFKRGIVSEPIDLSKYAAILGTD